MSRYLVPFVILLSLVLLGCAPPKRKSFIDRVYELDPSGRIFISKKLKASPPTRVVVLPFCNRVGSGRIFSLISTGHFRGGDEEEVARDIAERIHLAFYGQFAQLPFKDVDPHLVNQYMAQSEVDPCLGLTSMERQRLRERLNADAYVLGEITHYDFWYVLLYSQVAVGLSVRMMDSLTGEVLWRARDTRRDHTVRFTLLDPIAAGVGVFQAGFALRAINAMRAVDEISRELVNTLAGVHKGRASGPEVGQGPIPKQ